MARIIDNNPNSPTFGLLVEQGAPTPKAQYVNAPVPLEKVTDRPIEPLKQVAAGGGAIMVDDKIYTGGLGLNSYSPNKISQGSEGVRANMDTMLNGANNLNLNLGADIATTTIEDMRRLLGVKEPGVLTASDERAIEEAGAREAAKWAPLISEAERQKEKGFSKATISVGERGGFMSTQMAGAAALVPTVGSDFSGAGGKLNEIESDYDQNIMNIKAKALEAQSAAKEQARAAIEQRDSDAYKRAIELWKLAQDANKQAVALAQDKVDLVSSYKKLETARIDYNTGVLDNIAKVGGTVPDAMKAEADSLYGEGWTDLYIQASKAAAEADSEEAQIKTMKDITDLLKSYPAGKTLEIGGNTYETIGSSADTQIFKEEDRAGNITFLTVDKRSGEVINTASGGKVGKGTAPTSSSSSSSSASGGMDSKFWALVDRAKNELQQGETWGSVYNRIKAQYPNVPNATLDMALGGSAPEGGEATGWAKTGAYQEWSAGKKLPTESSSTPGGDILSDAESLL
jgi:hypothetical protein